MNIFQWIKLDAISRWNSVFQRWPEDKDVRRRMKAFMLGAGSGGRCSTLIETETSEDDPDPNNPNPSGPKPKDQI